ncbi:MAG: DUF1934 family protein [Gemella sp.]|nr:DUF1934 family protein [Gemella sp.]
MNIQVTTYVDNKKLLFEKNEGNFLEEENYYQITYKDKNSEACDIRLEKNGEKVVINRASSPLNIGKEVTVSQYKTPYGLMDLHTKLIGVDVKEKSKFIQFEIEYRIIFSKIDSQLTKLKILVTR